MAQLHELLAVEGDLKGAKDKIRDETITTFNKKTEHFEGISKRLEMFDESRRQEEGEERKELVDTVPDKLSYMSDYFVRYWDARLQKESSNQEARADIVVDEDTIARDVPATFLLSMEDELKQLRRVYEAIPTLQPGMAWERDTMLGAYVFKAVHPVIRLKTEKMIQSKIIVQPTKEHPAQVREWSEDRPVGRYVSTYWSGMVSPAEKSRMLRRIDTLLRAVKKARQRANNQEVVDRQIGKRIIDYINEF